MGPFLRVDLFVTSKPDGWRAVPAEIEMGGVETKRSMRTVDVAGPGETSHAVVFARSRDQGAVRPVLSGNPGVAAAGPSSSAVRTSAAVSKWRRTTIASFDGNGDGGRR